VVNLKTFGNRSDFFLIAASVSGLTARKLPITCAGYYSDPHMARSLVPTVSFLPEMRTPYRSRLDLPPVSVEEPMGNAPAKVRELAASAFAECRRLFSHAGLLHRLTLGGRRSTRRSPHSIPTWG
jgi:hypothetical protein